MSERTTEERLSYALNQVSELSTDELMDDIKSLMKLRGALIRALYWTDRIISEKHFESKSREKKPKRKRK